MSDRHYRQNHQNEAPIALDARKQFNTVQDMIQKAEAKIAQCLPKHLTPERMIRVALTTIQRNPKLLLCSPLSIVGTVVQASELGLELDGFLGQAYMVPFYNGKSKWGTKLEAQFQAGYRGLIALARRSGQVSSVSPELVYDWDTFKITLGSDRKLIHEPDMDHPDRGLRYEDGHDLAGDLIGLRGAYATVLYRDGSQDFEYCPLNRLEELRSRSQARKKQDGELVEVGPWTTDPAEMYRKVPIRQLAKRLPLSPEFQKAAVLDEYGDTGVRQNLGAIIEGDPAGFGGVLAAAAQQQADHLAGKYSRPQQQGQQGAAAA